MIDKEKRIKSSLYVTFYQSLGVLGLEMFFIKMIRGSVILRYEYVFLINMDFSFLSFSSTDISGNQFLTQEIQ